MAQEGVKVELKPSPKMKMLYIIYVLLIVLVGILSWCVPITILFINNRLVLALLVLLITVYLPLGISLTIFTYWLPRYYDSIKYIVEEDRLIVRKGVWWTSESSIPISKINNVEYKQGPLQRTLGLATLGFHTAAKGVPVPEIVFAHMDAHEANKVREYILRKLRPIPKETYEEKVLRELNRIRELLEKITS
ncbi:MAG: hypothetical protein DRZ82_04865 [Thermoprotei archaeon]|nr:MAG: hypothetical protein DRZ82_04865 [Thermoprotei archaeon]